MTAASTRAFLKKLKWSRVEFKLESLLWRAAYRAEKRKPSSAPYLSGDGFRSLCSRFFEPETKQDFDPGEIREGDLVFCEAWNLPEFLSGPASSGCAPVFDHKPQRRPESRCVGFPVDTAARCQSVFPERARLRRTCDWPSHRAGEQAAALQRHYSGLQPFEASSAKKAAAHPERVHGRKQSKGTAGRL